MKPFVYALFDPLEPKCFRYIGMALTNPKRPYQHTKNRDNQHLRNWVQKLHREGRKYGVLILEELEENAPNKEVSKVEVNHIRIAKEQGHNLTNLTEGGEGGMLLNKYKHSQETKEKIQKALLGHKVSQETRNKMSSFQAHRIKHPNQGKKHSQETREKMSQSHSTISSETREKLCLSHLGKQPMLGHTHSEESREKMKQSNFEYQNKSFQEKAEIARKRADRLAVIAEQLALQVENPIIEGVI